MQIKEIMKKPYIVNKDIDISEAAKIMSSKNISCLIFVDEDKVKGIVTEGDILKEFGRHENISHVMTKNVITISPKDDLNDALKEMLDNGIKKLPVVEKGKLVGFVSLSDLAACMDELDEDFFFK